MNLYSKNGCNIDTCIINFKFFKLIPFSECSILYDSKCKKYVNEYQILFEGISDLKKASTMSTTPKIIQNYKSKYPMQHYNVHTNIYTII